MLRPLDVILLLCGRYGAWARGRMAYRALAVLVAPERVAPEAARASLGRLDEVRHEDGVDELAASLVVPLAVSLALEAEGLVEAERRLVPGKDVQLELAHARVARPRDRVRRGARVPTPRRRWLVGDHEAEVGDVPARRVRIAREREAPDDRSSVLGDEHGGVGVALDRAQVPPLVRRRRATGRCRGSSAPPRGRRSPRGRRARRRRAGSRAGRWSCDDDAHAPAPRVARGLERVARPRCRQPARRRRRGSGRPSG